MKVGGVAARFLSLCSTGFLFSQVSLHGAWNSFLITRHEGGCKLPISDVSGTVAGEPHKGQEEGKARSEVETFVLGLAQPLPPADLEPRHLN